MRVARRWSSRTMARSCWSLSFSSFTGRPSGPTTFAFAIAFITVTISSVGSIPRVLATGYCISLVGMSRSSMSNLTFSIERKNRTHISQIGPSSGNILASSSRRHCDPTFFLYSSCIGLMFWTSPCWSPMRKCFSNSMTWRSKK